MGSQRTPLVGGWRRRPPTSVLLGPALVGLWAGLSDATPAAAHAAGGGGASGVAGARGVAVGAAFATLVFLVGPLAAGTGRVDRVRGALARIAPLVVVALVGSIDLSRPAQLLAVAAAATVALAPAASRWRALPAVALVAIVTAGSIGDMALRDRLLGGSHVIAGAVWLGLVLEVVARWIGDPALGRRLLHRLSAPALGALVAVAATGGLIASEHLGDARLALGSWWGKGLAVKLALVAGAAIVGALARRPWAPRLEGGALAGVALLGLLLGVAGSPLSGDNPAGPLFARDGGADVLITPLRAGTNTVVVRVADVSAPVRVEIDGQVAPLTERPDGLLAGEVDLPEGRHRLRVGDELTTVTIGPDDGGTVLRANLPDHVEDPDCLDGLAGLAAAAAALRSTGQPVRFELTVGGDTCGPAGGFPSRADLWAATASAAFHGMRARGSAGPLVVVADDGARARALVDALAQITDLVEVPAHAFDATARGIEPGSLVLVATERSGARPVVEELARATGATVPVVLAPWLLDASVLRDITDEGVSVLVAAHRTPTAAEAVGYRGGAARSTGGGWAITAAGYEAYLGALEELTGASIGGPAPGVYTASRFSVLPAGVDHPSEAGWAPGVAIVKVA